jgi:hypothetical protein
MSRTNGNGRSYQKFYYALRIYLHKKRWLLRFAQILRAYVVLGPFKKFLIRYYQTFSNNDPLRTDRYPLFPNVDADRLVGRIDEVGYAHLGHLPEEYVTKILQYCEKNKQIQYWNPHKECEAVDRLCRNAKIVEIARKYLGAEPILWLTQLKWSFRFSDDSVDLRPSPHTEPAQYDAHAFHYDSHDFKSLTLFVYLTDVDMDSGPHKVIERTHKKTLKEIRSIVLKDDVAQKIYGDRIKVILGKKGTVFIEETSSYHKAEACKKRRLLLSIDYVLRRKAPPGRPILLALLYQAAVIACS